MTRIALILTIFFHAGLSLAQSSLVSTEWLAKQNNDQSVVLIDMSDNLQYQRFHLPGAINLPYDYLVQNKNKISLSIDKTRLIKLLGQIGISQNSYVIAYDDTGGLHAARLLWELDQLDHPKAALLDGGLVKWIREGRPVSAETPTLHSTHYQARKPHHNATATLKDVAPASRDRKTVVIDVRSDEEYIGDPGDPRSGHIPGAKWWQWDQALSIDEGFSLRSDKALMDELSDLGLKNKDQPVIVYCRSGHRAAHSYFTLRQLGFKNVRLYDGSMKEYEQHKDQPLNKGKQP